MDWRCFMTHFRWILIFLLLGHSLQAFSVDFPRKKIAIGNHTLSVEVAETPDQRQQGLMNRTSLAKNQGMLFIFDRPQPLSFWMKNTLIPLSIGFFDKDRKLLNVRQMHPPKSVMVQDHQLERYSSEGPAKFALEMNLGWFEANKIKKGSQFHWK